MKKLYRSTEDKKLLGVCGGLAAYFGIDATIVRLIWIILSLAFAFGFGGLLIYILCGFIIPKKPDYIEVTEYKEVD